MDAQLDLASGTLAYVLNDTPLVELGLQGNLLAIDCGNEAGLFLLEIGTFLSLKRVTIIINLLHMLLVLVDLVLIVLKVLKL